MNNDPRVLVFIMWFTDKSFGIESVIYKEYLKLSKRTKLIVLAKHVDNANLDNMKIIEIPKTRKPLWTIRNIIAFSLKSIRARNEFDIVFTRMIGLHVLIPVRLVYCSTPLTVS